MIQQQYVDEQDDFFVSEEKSSKITNNSRQETELFDEEKYVEHDIINVKYIELPRGGEDWEILKNKKLIFTIKGVRLTKKEKIFLRTADGMLFLISTYKNGCKSVLELKRKLKKMRKIKKSELLLPKGKGFLF